VTTGRAAAEGGAASLSLELCGESRPDRCTVVRTTTHQAVFTVEFVFQTKRSFHPTQRTQRNAMTSLLARPITAASDDSVCRWHAAKLWQTRPIKYEIIEIKFDFIINCTTCENNLLKFGRLIFFNFKL